MKDDLRAKPEYQDPSYLAFESAIQEMMFRSAEAGKNHRISLVFDRQDKGFRDRALTVRDGVIVFNSVLRSELASRGWPTDRRAHGRRLVTKVPCCLRLVRVVRDPT